jgi:hypothetical protein
MSKFLPFFDALDPAGFLVIRWVLKPGAELSELSLGAVLPGFKGFSTLTPPVTPALSLALPALRWETLMVKYLLRR